jgi:hypothetical protein
LKSEIVVFLVEQFRHPELQTLNTYATTIVGEMAANNSTSRFKELGSSVTLNEK